MSTPQLEYKLALPSYAEGENLKVGLIVEITNNESFKYLFFFFKFIATRNVISWYYFNKKQNSDIHLFFFTFDEKKQWLNKMKSLEEPHEFQDLTIISLYNVSPQRAAKIIHQNSIHILLDMQGNSKLNLLQVQYYRPAPIQVLYGYYCTSGI